MVARRRGEGKEEEEEGRGKRGKGKSVCGFMAMVHGVWCVAWWGSRHKAAADLTDMH